LGVALEKGGGGPRGLPVGGAGDQEPVEALQVPARAHELGGQPVEELGMTGPLALDPEVLDGLHDPRAEEELPGAVHRHPAP